MRPAGTAEEAPVPTDDPFALKQPVREEWLPMLKGPEAAFAEVTLAKLPKGVAPPADLDHDPDQRPTHGPGNRSDQANGGDRDAA